MIRFVGWLAVIASVLMILGGFGEKSPELGFGGIGALLSTAFIFGIAEIIDQTARTAHFTEQTALKMSSLVQARANQRP